ncbi:hypothetical protein K438DRAFT_1979786 [Mycena galopus ATCC 62051]|nr:hypothetical protein K438DRAFT_1979786 [Mycena galopus ATCC 62051]
MNFIIALLIPAISAMVVNGIIPPASLKARGDVLPRICALACEHPCKFTLPCDWTC